jgi:uncharacterized protein (TIRG00374 family)
MTKSGTSRRLLTILGRLGALALLVALALWKADLSTVSTFLSGRTFVYVLILQPIALLCAVFLAKRYAVLLQNPSVGFTVAFRAVILANGINVILPGRLSEVLKATYVNEKTGQSISKALSAVVLERIGDVIIFLALAFVCVGSVLFRVEVKYLALLGAAVVGSLAFLAGSERAIYNFAGRLRIRFLTGFLQQFVTHAASSLKSRTFYIAQLYGILAWTFSFILMTVFVLLAGSIGLDVSQVLLLFTATTVGLLIPLLPGGIGTYEAAAIYVLRGFGYGIEEALVLSIAMHVSQLLFVFVASLVIVSSEHIGIMGLVKRIRTMAHEDVQPSHTSEHLNN